MNGLAYEHIMDPESFKMFPICDMHLDNYLHKNLRNIRIKVDIVAKCKIKMSNQVSLPLVPVWLMIMNRRRKMLDQISTLGDMKV